MADVWSCGVILYALLVGALPFDDDNLRNLLEKVKKGVFHIPPFVSPDCQSLLRAMIEVDPRKRITLKEVLEHKWVTSDQNIPLQLELPMTQAVQTAIIPSRADIDPDIFGTMTSLQCFRDQEKLVEELLSPVHNTEKVIYFLLLDRKLRNPSSDDPEEIRSRSSTLSLGSSKADPPRKRIDSLKLTLNGSSRLSLGNLSEGSPLSGRRGLAVQKLRKKSFSSGLDSQSSTPAVSPLGSPLSLQRVHSRTVSCENTVTIQPTHNSLAIPQTYRPQPSLGGSGGRHTMVGCSEINATNTSVSSQSGKNAHSIPSADTLGVPIGGHPHPNMNIYCLSNISPLGPGAQHLLHPSMAPLPVPPPNTPPFVPALHLLPHMHPHPYSPGTYLIPTISPFPGPVPMSAPPTQHMPVIAPATMAITSPSQHSIPSTAVTNMGMETKPMLATATTPAIAATQATDRSSPSTATVKERELSEGSNPSVDTVSADTLEGSKPDSDEFRIPESASHETKQTAVRSKSRESISAGKVDNSTSVEKTLTQSRNKSDQPTSASSAYNQLPSTAPSSPIESLLGRSKPSSIPSSPPTYVSRHTCDYHSIPLQHSQAPSVAPTTKTVSVHPNATVTTNNSDKSRTNGITVANPIPSVRTPKSPLLCSSSPSSDKKRGTYYEGTKGSESRTCGSPTYSSPTSRSRHANTMAPSTPSGTSTPHSSPSSQPWRMKLNSLKISFLGSPRFHRKKSNVSGLVEETPPASPKVNISHGRTPGSGRSTTTEPSPLLTHKSWFDGFLSAASGHVIVKGSQNAYNAAAAAEDAAALAISTNSRINDSAGAQSGSLKMTNEIVHPPAVVHERRNRDRVESNSVALDSGATQQTHPHTTALNSGPISERAQGRSRGGSVRQITICEASADTHSNFSGSSEGVHSSIGGKSSDRRGNKTSAGTNGPSTLPEETNHVIMIKGRALNRLKAELVQVFLATPGVVHTVISPTSFRAEYRRAGSGSSLLARPVKLQVDMVRATGGISTGSHAANTMAAVPSEREVYAVNFQLLSGPTRRFKRLCDQLQAALLTGPSHPSFMGAGPLLTGNGSVEKAVVSDLPDTTRLHAGNYSQVSARFESEDADSTSRLESTDDSPRDSYTLQSSDPTGGSSRDAASISQPPSSQPFTLTDPESRSKGDNNGVSPGSCEDTGKVKG
ncbi:unnamed protein product [Calicophoron daubneyi]|uniref:non-specific serine/threonine protein kinase n=1 Tax=Calicophoron daubneyi TaxID=300641 RepID=A0AAV2TI26_CALDB